LAILIALGASAAAAPTVQIDYPEKEHWYSSVSSAEGTASADPGVAVDEVYCQLYYYSIGHYTYTYWNWVTGIWQTSPTWDTMKLATGTDSWHVDSGFPAGLPADPARTYALYARVYDANGGVGADVNYFYIGDTTPPTIDLTILQPTLWPPNGKLVLAAEVSVQDDHDPTPEVVIDVTTSDPPKPGRGKPAWEVVRDGDVWQVWLAAKKAKKGGERAYTISVTATDDAGNTSGATGTVSVR
jgi:hypothetical protein